MISCRGERLFDWCLKLIKKSTDVLLH